MAREFAGTERIAVPTTATLLTSLTGTIILWFKIPTTVDQKFLYDERAAFNKELRAFVTQNDDPTDAKKIRSVWRTPTANATIISTSDFDDDVWHWYYLVRRGTADFELFVDGTSEGTFGTTTGITDAGTSNFVGNNTVGPGNGPAIGDIARYATWNVALTLGEARTFAFTGRTARKPLVYYELGLASPEPDWSGSGRDGVLSGTPGITSHAPVGPWFGYDLGWQGAFTAAVANAPTGHLLGPLHGPLGGPIAV